MTEVVFQKVEKGNLTSVLGGFREKKRKKKKRFTTDVSLGPIFKNK